MPTDAPYTYLAYDVAANTQVDELPFITFEWEEVLNRPGGFRAQLPLRHPKATTNSLYPWRTAIYVDQAGQLRFGGIVTKVEATADDTGTLAVEGVGFFGYYTDDHRTIQSRQGMTYATGTGAEIRFAAVDQFRIVADLIAHAGYYNGGSVGLTVAMHGPSGGGISGVTRDRSYYRYERKCLGEAIAQLAEVDDGFDYSVGVAWSGTTPAKTLDLWYPRQGRSIDLVFEQQKNVNLLRWSLDGSRMANWVTALGAGDGNRMKIATNSNANLIYPNAPWPMLEAVTSYRDVSHQSTLAAHAKADRLERRWPVETIALEIINTDDTPLGGFIVGDDIQVIANDGYVTLNGRYRIQSVRVGISVDGQTSIGVELATLDASLRRGD